MHMLVLMEVFAAVVEQGSFTAAAEVLGVSKSVVSKQVTQLEAELNAQLLSRSTRRLHVTEIGEVFYRHCRKVVTEAHDARAAVAPLQGEVCGTLQISAPPCLADPVLRTLLPQFQVAYPGLIVDITVSGRLADLVGDGIDLALRIGELSDSNLIARRLTGGEFMVCASADYWQEHGIPQHPEELRFHNSLIFSEAPHLQYWLFRSPEGEEIRVPVKGNLRSSDVGLLIAAARAGQGVLAGPSFMFRDALEDGSLRPVLQQYDHASAALFAVYPYNKHVLPKVRAFVDFLYQHLDEGGRLIRRVA